MFALNISEKYIRAIELVKEKGAIFIRAMGEKEYEGKQSLPGQIKDLLKNTKPHPIQSSQVAIAIPEEETFIKVIRFPKKEGVSLEKQIQEELGKILPYSPNEVYWDWRLAEEDYRNKSFCDAVIVAATKKIIDSYIDLLTQAGLEPILIETEANALIWGSLNPFNEKKTITPTLIVDFESEKTTIVIFANGAIRFTTSSKGYSSDQKHFLSERDLKEISNKLRECINYYNDQFSSQERAANSIKEVIVRGEWATFQEMTSFLEKELALPIKGPANLIPIKPSYAATLGLAFRGLSQKDHAYL